MKDKIAVGAIILIFGLIIGLTAVSSEWGMSLLSSFLGDTFHFSK